MNFTTGPATSVRPRSSAASGKLTALALVFAVKHTAPRHTADRGSGELLLAHLLGELGSLGVTDTALQTLDLDAEPVRIESAVQDAVATADILLIAAPTWSTPHRTIARHILDYLCPALPEAGTRTGKVAAAAVIGDRHGARRIIKDFAYGLTDLGFTVPAPGGIYWDGEPDSTIPPPIRVATQALARDAAHLAKRNIPHRPPPP